MTTLRAFGPPNERTYRLRNGKTAVHLAAKARWPFVITTRPIANRRTHLVGQLDSLWSEGKLCSLAALTMCGSRLGSVAVVRNAPDEFELCDFCVLADFQSPCVYRTYDAAGNLLYIGCSTDLFSRFLSHSKSFDPISAWWPLLATWTATPYPSHAEALEAERLAILAEQPSFNRTSPTVRDTRRELAPRTCTFCRLPRDPAIQPASRAARTLTPPSQPTTPAEVKSP